METWPTTGAGTGVGSIVGGEDGAMARFAGIRTGVTRTVGTKTAGSTTGEGRRGHLKETEGADESEMGMPRDVGADAAYCHYSSLKWRSLSHVSSFLSRVKVVWEEQCPHGWRVEYAGCFCSTVNVPNQCVVRHTTPTDTCGN